MNLLSCFYFCRDGARGKCTTTLDIKRDLSHSDVPFQPQKSFSSPEVLLWVRLSPPAMLYAWNSELRILPEEVEAGDIFTKF